MCPGSSGGWIPHDCSGRRLRGAAERVIVGRTQVKLSIASVCLAVCILADGCPARADEVALHPVVRIGWSSAELVTVGAGAGTAWPRIVESDRHVRLAGGVGLSGAGASMFVEAG